MDIKEWLRPRSVEELKAIHLAEKNCAFCNHVPTAAPTPDDLLPWCWCPICITANERDIEYKLIIIPAYADDCVRHGMAPPHFNGTLDETCDICQNKPGPGREE